MLRIIAHLDMDAFFAAVEERDNPRFKGRPIVVGADPKEGSGRGVVSTANYAARKFGIRSATPISKAWQLAKEARKRGEPETLFLPVNFKKYGEASKNIMEILRGYAEHVEEASVDEAYFDLSFTGGFRAARELCEKIKSEIKKKERLTASVGIGPNKLIAKIGSDMQKPDGLTVVLPEEAEKFLEPLAIRKIPGIGPKTEQVFLKMGVHTVKDLKSFSQEKLNELLGKWGLELYEKIRARDVTPIVEEYEAKSIGEQETFEEDTLDANFIVERLRTLAQNVVERFKRSGFRNFRTIVLTVRFEDFETKTRSHTLKEPIFWEKSLFPEQGKDVFGMLVFEALNLLLPFLDKRENHRHRRLRLIGVRIEKLG